MKKMREILGEAMGTFVLTLLGFCLGPVALVAGILLVAAVTHADDFKETQGFLDIEVNKNVYSKWIS